MFIHGAVKPHRGHSKVCVVAVVEEQGGVAMVESTSLIVIFIFLVRMAEAVEQRHVRIRHRLISRVDVADAKEQ